MAKILFTWELGEDLGHITKIYPLAEELCNRGHEIYVVTRDLYSTEPLFSDLNVVLFQSPFNTATVGRASTSRSYSSILVGQGYGSKDSLLPLVRAWRTLLGFIQPDAIVFDYSPTAHIAARDLRIPKITIGSAFWSPAPGWPPDDLCYWKPRDNKTIDRYECRAVNAVNDVANVLNLPKVGYLSDILLSDRTFFLHPPTFDRQHGTRSDTYYLAPMSERRFPQCVWPSRNKKNVFAYLKFGALNAENVLAELIESGENIVCYYARSSAAACSALSKEGVYVTNKPVDLMSVLEGADLVVSHAGIGIVSSALYLGKPMLLVPTHLEQLYNARQVKQSGAGHWVDRGESRDLIRNKLDDVLHCQTFQDKARELAVEYQNLAPTDSRATICDEIEALIFKESVGPAPVVAGTK